MERKKKVFNLQVDQLYTGHWKYISKETDADHPIIRGLYIQHVQFDDEPPMMMRITLEWDEAPAAEA